MGGFDDGGQGGICQGSMQFESCSGHQDCNQDLSCRSTTVWPYTTSCLPRGDEGSSCNDDYDCKTSAYCWKLGETAERKCLQKHSAITGTVFFWDSNTYPIVNKTSVLFHGQYCKTGFAFRNSSNTSICTQIDEVRFNNTKTSVVIEEPY